MSPSTGTVVFEDATLKAVELVAETITLNNFSVSATTSLQQATNTGNVTTNTVEFTNPTTAFVTTANVEVGGYIKNQNVAFFISVEPLPGTESRDWGTAASATATDQYKTQYNTPVPIWNDTQSRIKLNRQNCLTIESFSTENTSGLTTGYMAKFTAPYSGLYSISFFGCLKNLSGSADYVALSLSKNVDTPSAGAETVPEYLMGNVSGTEYGANAQTGTMGGTIVVYLQEGDFLVPFTRSAALGIVEDGSNLTFCGYFIG